jgi:hypothetical protein
MRGEDDKPHTNCGVHTPFPFYFPFLMFSLEMRFSSFAGQRRNNYNLEFPIYTLKKVPSRTCSNESIPWSYFTTDLGGNLNCKDCKSVAPLLIKAYRIVEPEFWWAGLYFCTRCHETWAACHLCTYRVRPYSGGRELRRHTSRSKIQQELASSRMKAEADYRSKSAISATKEEEGRPKESKDPVAIGVGDVAIESTFESPPVDSPREYAFDNDDSPLDSPFGSL